MTIDFVFKINILIDCADINFIFLLHYELYAVVISY